jgi:hypothetical protein
MSDGRDGRERMRREGRGREWEAGERRSDGRGFEGGERGRVMGEGMGDGRGDGLMATGGRGAADEAHSSQQTHEQASKCSGSSLRSRSTRGKTCFSEETFGEERLLRPEVRSAEDLADECSETCSNIKS